METPETESLVVITIAAEAWADVGFDKPEELTWWDWIVFLLHTAAEIEHALMVQYLYAAYSLAESNFQGPQVPPNAPQLVNGWRRSVLAIAREEMAHLLTIQNLLRFIGGAINMDREDFPFLALLYPFKLHLEPLSKSSLAKYVAAEMPANPDIPDDLMEEIIRRASSPRADRRSTAWASCTKTSSRFSRTARSCGTATFSRIRRRTFRPGGTIGKGRARYW